MNSKISFLLLRCVTQGSKRIFETFNSISCIGREETNVDRKIMLVTGTTDGIGLQTAQNLAKMNHHVIIRWSQPNTRE